MYVCMYVCMYVFIYICMYLYIYIYMCVCEQRRKVQMFIFVPQMRVIPCSEDFCSLSHLGQIGTRSSPIGRLKVLQTLQQGQGEARLNCKLFIIILYIYIYISIFHDCWFNQEQGFDEQSWDITRIGDLPNNTIIYYLCVGGILHFPYFRENCRNSRI